MTAHEHLEAIVILGVGSHDFDYSFSDDWIDADELEEKLQEFFVDTMSKFEIVVPSTAVERANIVGLIRNSASFESKGNEYTGQWYKYNGNGRAHFVANYIVNNHAAKLLSELNYAARLRAMHRVAEELEWPKIEDFDSDPEDSTEIATDYAPGSDRLVEFTDNQPAADHVVVLTEAADEAIRGSNSLIEDQRGWIRDHLRAGIDFIKHHKKMLAGAASALLLQPLLAAYEAVAEEPAKMAILAAIEAIKILFGL